MSKRQYIGYTPRAHQKAVNEAVIGKYGVVCTVKSRRQSGKSFMSLNLLLYYALNRKKCVSALVSVTLAQSRKVFQELVAAVDSSGVIARKNEQTLEIFFINGSKIFFKSSEQGTDSLRGYTINGILILDEASFLSENILEAVLPWTNVHRPPLLIVSTPKFRNCFFYRYFMKGLAGEKNYVSIDWNNYDLSEFLSDEQLNEYRMMLPRNQFKTEFLGEFLDDDGVVFENFRECIGKAGEVKDLYIGVDWASGLGEDYTVMSVLNGKGEQVAIHRFNNMNTTDTIDHLTNILQGYGVAVRNVLCESNSIGTPMSELLIKANPRLNISTAATTNTSKGEMVSALQVLFEKNNIRILDDEAQTGEIASYEAVYNPKTKNVSYNAPLGLHDDTVMALMLAVKALQTGQKKGKYSIR